MTIGAREFGLTLSQRGAFFDYTTVGEVVETAVRAEEAGQYEAVWVGDSILAVPRPESIALLGAMAGRTTDIKLAVGCLASFTIRDPALLAAQWATLDQISAGRMLLAVCTGIVKAESASEREGALYGVTDRSRARRMEEGVEVLRRLWTGSDVHFEGKYMQLSGVTVEPKPVQDLPPIYLASQPVAGTQVAERQLQRLARIADGWMTARKNPASIGENAKALRSFLREEGREADPFPIVAYHNVNLNPDREAALEETDRFLKLYYGPIFSPEDVEGWTAAGTAEQVVDDLSRVFEEGATQVALRVTSWSWRDQLDLITNEVIPTVRAAGAA
jgi:alkanesulfonate monooxygenase SsuD/methylene tetrahydromethanopterin reductase-like flavin-dependent oxidoreductase (luciferase family)